jgi:hypothetical protein
MVNRVVTYAKLHGPIHVPSIGNIKETLTPDATGTTKDLKMVATDLGILATIKGVEVFIPYTMVTHMVLAKQ